MWNEQNSDSHGRRSPAFRTWQHSSVRIGFSIFVPSAIVGAGWFHLLGGVLPSSCPRPSSTAVAIGEQASGCTTQSFGSV
jgi:hypothetical protein